IARVPAKINPVLSVGPKRPDGFHDLATVFHAVSLYDEVRAAPGDGVSLTLSGPYAVGVPTDDSNLAVRAAHALAAHADVPAQVTLSVHKEIPVAAGLAGGSADAAGTLRACARLWQLELPDAELAAVAASLGSDVPFALMAGTAEGTGRGERLRAIPVGARLHWVLAVADGELSTPAVYARLDELRQDRCVASPSVGDDMPAALAAGDPQAVGRGHPAGRRRPRCVGWDRLRLGADVCLPRPRRRPRGGPRDRYGGVRYVRRSAGGARPGGVAADEKLDATWRRATSSTSNPSR